jgi:protein tyrosine/serine phosphatase
MKQRIIRSLKLAGASVSALVFLTAGWAGYLHLSGNFHAVEDGAVYRSGQLSGAELSSRIRENGILTIINLRGNNAGSPWYDDEIKASTAAGVQHIDFPLSADQELTREEVVQLAKFLERSNRPILIHCKAGADRSGLVSALYKLLIRRRPPEEAAAQLSFRYGHFPWLGSRTVAMDRTFARIASRVPLTQ